jgi:hypothetical protein
MDATFTLIEDGPIKGLLVLGISKEEAEKLISLVKYEVQEEKEAKEMIEEADREESWVTLEEARKELQDAS